MVYILLIILSVFIAYSLYTKEYGILACFVLFYFRIVTTFLFNISPSEAEHDSIYLAGAYLLLLILPGRYRQYSVIKYFTNPIVLTMLFFVIVMLISDYITSFYYDFHSKSIESFHFSFFINVLFPFLIIPFCITNNRDKNNLLFSVILFGAYYIIQLLTIFGFDSSLFQMRGLILEQTEGIISSIPLSRYAGISVVATTVYLIYSNKSKKAKFLISLCLVLFIITLLISGQRGSIIGVILALLSLLFKRGQQKKLLLTIIPILIILMIIHFFDFEVFNRFKELQSYQKTERYHDYFITWEIFKNHGFWGLGSQGYMFMTGREYPHNIILEHMSNYGYLGFACISIILGIGVVYSIRILKYSSNFYDSIISCCWIMLGTSAMVSASINGQKFFYIFTGLLALVYINSVIEPEDCEVNNIESKDQFKLID